MSEFSITEAAFSGFRMAARKPTTILVWAIAYLVFSVAIGFMTVSMAGPALTEMQALQAQARADPSSANPAATLALLGQVVPLYLAMIPLGLFFGAVTLGAVTRSVLRPSEGGFGYLRFSADELRLIVVMIVVGLVIGGIYIGGVIVMAIAAAVAGGVGGRGAALPVVIAVACPVFLLVFYVGSRLSMAPSLTLDRKAINIFGSFGLTKGRGGRVFLSCLLALILNVLVIAVGFAIVAGAALAMGGGAGAVMSMIRPDMSSMAVYFSPVRIIYYVVMSLVGSLGLAVLLSPPAFIYQALVRDGVDEVF